VLLLKQGGELVFITSDYWLSTLHSQNLRMFLIQNGSFECIHSFGEKPVFKSVNTSIIVFKFVKGRVATDIRIEEMEGKDIHPLQPDACKIRMKSSHCIAPFANQERWNIGSLQYDVELARLQRLCFDPHLQRIVQVNDVCDIANGMVSGLDRAFQIPHIEYVSTHPSWMVPIVKAKHLRAYGYDESIAYCMIPSGLTEDAVRQGDPQMYAHLLPYRSLLEKRFSYGRDLPFWEWAFPRSFKRLSQTGLKIFVPSKERVKPYRGLRFALVDTPHMPTQDVTAILLKDTTYPIQYVAALLNHPLWAKWFLAYGVIKGGVLEFSERPLSRAPFLSIDFQNTFEVHICQKIVDAVDRLRFDPTPSQNDLIVKLVDELLANKDVQVTNCI
jgi:adenine-specific DNA-methyltransferase